MITEYFECACFSEEHMMVIHFEEEYGDLWIDVHLDNQRWYKRVWAAIKHIFGYKCKYGCFDTWMIKQKDVDRMIELLQKKKQLDEQAAILGSAALPTTE